MDHYAGIDVSLESASVCVVDASGRIAREGKVASEPEVLIAWFGSAGLRFARIGLEAGPLSQWLYAAMREAGSENDVRDVLPADQRLQPYVLWSFQEVGTQLGRKPNGPSRRIF
jgi:transposase